MITFKTFTFLIEEEDQSSHLNHLDHPYQMHVLYGKRGAEQAVNDLKSAHDYFTTGKSNKISASRKVDGGVSVIISNHPTFGPSVSTKSAFNVKPKINYTEEDIDKNHGHAPGLANTLKHLLKHGKNLVNSGHSVQGDVLYTNEPKKTEDNKVSTTPNRIEYRHEGAPKKFGIALHTEYEGNTAKTGVSPKAINSTKNIFVADTDFTPKPEHYSEKNRNIASKHLELAKELVNKHGDHFDVSKEHKEHILTYMNSLRSEAGPIATPTHQGYIDHLNKIKERKKASVKTSRAKEEKESHFNKLQNEVNNNKSKFKSIFDFHDHINKVTEALTSTLAHNKASNFSSHIDNAPSTDEGIVIANKSNRNILFKLVPNKIASALKYNPRFNRTP